MSKFKCKDCNNIFASEASEEQESNPDAGTGFYDSPNGYQFGKRPQGDDSEWPSDTWMPKGTEMMDAEYWDNIAASLSKPTVTKFSKYETAVPRSEAKFRVLLFDGRGVQYFSNQEEADKFYEHALKTELDPCEPESFVYKKASNLSHAYWVDPQGKIYTVRPSEFNQFDLFTHSDWVVANQELLKEQYGINLDLNCWKTMKEMYAAGWARVGDSGQSDMGYGITVGSLSHIPEGVDIALAQFYKGEELMVEGEFDNKTVLIDDPFPNLQDAVNKALQQKRMGALSKKDLKEAAKSYGENAICPTCGEWKPTDFSPAELQEREWECMDCANKRLTTPESIPQDHGSKEISMYDPEYEFLKKLINVVVKAGVNPQEIKDLSLANPFVTVDDAGDLAAKIWTLATEKYQIPRKWLLSKFPEKKVKGALSKKELNKVAYYSDLFSFIISDPQTKQYFAERGIDISELKKILPKLDITYWNDNSPVTTPGGATTIADMKLNKGVDMEKYFGAYYYPPTKQIYVNPKTSIEDVRGTLIHEIEHALQDKGGILPHHKKWMDIPYDVRTHEWGAELSAIRSFKNQGYSLEQIFKHYLDRTRQYGDDSLSEETKNKIEQLYELSDEVEPQSVVSVLSKKELFKQANPPTRLWVAPDGQEFNADPLHGYWTNNNPEILKQYGINPPKGRYGVGQTWDEMISKGWIRISNEPAGSGFTIQVEDIHNIPKTVDNVIAKYFKNGDVIQIGENKNTTWVEITDPFPSIQKAVNKALRQPVRASLKQADLKEYSNQATKEVNYWIIRNPHVMERVIEQSQYSVDSDELFFRLKALISQLDYEEYNNPDIRWDELAYAWFNTVHRGIPVPEDTSLVNIEKLPVLDKKQKLDELLDQLSAESDPVKQEKIKQHIERIKRANLKQASSIENVDGVRVYVNPTWKQAVSLLSTAKYVELRGVIEPATGTLFIWDSNTLTHENVIRALAIDIDPYAENEEADYLSVMSDTGGLDYMFMKQQEAKSKLSKSKKKADAPPCICGCSLKDHYFSGTPEEFCKFCAPDCMKYRPQVNKKADLSGSTVNDILKHIHQDGGSTYNFTKGNMAGTDSYAVAIYPDRSRILEYPLDFEELERYIVDNQDLLSNPMNSFGAWVNEGKVHLDVVSTVPHKDQAIALGKEHNQIAIFDLKNFQEIPTGGTGEVTKQAEESLLSEDQQNQVASKWGPVMNIALQNYAQAIKNGHDSNRALQYAIESVSNIGTITKIDLIDAINTYLP